MQELSTLHSALSVIVSLVCVLGLHLFKPVTHSEPSLLILVLAREGSSWEYNEMGM